MGPLTKKEALRLPLFNLPFRAGPGRWAAPAKKGSPEAAPLLIFRFEQGQGVGPAHKRGKPEGFPFLIFRFEQGQGVGPARKKGKP